MPSQRLTVGYIGLGLMGKSIARNILKAGFPMIVHNRSRQAVEELVAEGAKAAFSPAEVTEQVDLVFTNLPDTPDVIEVVLGKRGVFDGAHAGLIYVDNSTIRKRLKADRTHRVSCINAGTRDLVFRPSPLVGVPSSTL